RGVRAGVGLTAVTARARPRRRVIAGGAGGRAIRMSFRKTLPRDLTELGNLLRHFCNVIHGLADQNARLAARIEQLEAALMGLIDQLPGASNRPYLVEGGLVARRPGWGSVRAVMERELKEKAKAGVAIFNLVRRDDGKCDVEVGEA